MNRDEKAAVVEEVAAQIQEAGTVLAVDYRGLSVTQAAELRTRLAEADATFRVVKNRLTSRAADKAGADSLKELLEGPTAFTFVRGDAALAAKALSNFRRDHGLLAFKGGTMDGDPLSAEQVEAIARLPGREQLQGQFVGVLASPLTGLVRGLASLIQGLALQLGQLQEQGLVGGEAPEAESGQAPGGEGAPVPEVESGEADAGERTPEADAPADPAEAEQEATGDEETSGEAGAAGAEASDEQSDASGEAEAKED